MFTLTQVLYDFNTEYLFHCYVKTAITTPLTENSKCQQLRYFVIKTSKNTNPLSHKLSGTIIGISKLLYIYISVYLYCIPVPVYLCNHLTIQILFFLQFYGIKNKRLLLLNHYNFWTIQDTKKKSSIKIVEDKILFQMVCGLIYLAFLHF